MGAGLKNPIRHGPTGCARRCAREGLTTAKITPHRPTSSEKTPRGLEGRCSIQLSYRRVLVFCGVSERESRRGQCQFDCSFGSALGGTYCRALTLRAPVAPGSLGSPPGTDARARPGTRLPGAGSAKCPAFATGAPPGRSWLRWVRSSKVLPRGLAGSRHLARAPGEPCAPPPESRRARPARQPHGGDRR